MDLDASRRQSRDCCCHVRQSMLVAAGFMIAGSVFALFAASINNYWYFVGAILWFTAGFCAILAVKRQQPILLVVTIVVISVLLIVKIGAMIALIALRSKITNDQLRNVQSQFDEIMISASVTFLFGLAFDIWFLVVSVKCRRYLMEQERTVSATNHNSLSSPVQTIFVLRQPFQL